jgi:hypothetical protein
MISGGMIDVEERHRNNIKTSKSEIQIPGPDTR